MNREQIIQYIKKYPIAVTGLGVAIVFGIVLYLRSGVLPELEEKYEESDKTVQMMRRNDVNAVNLSQSLEEIRSLVAEMESRLMKEDARTNHLRYFLSLAEDSKVEMSDPLNTGRIAAGPKQPLKTYSQLQWKIRVTGKLSNVLDFIHKAETGFHPISIQALNISPVQNRQDGTVAVELNLNVLAKP